MDSPEMGFRENTGKQPFLREVKLESLTLPRTAANANWQPSLPCPLGQVLLDTGKGARIYKSECRPGKCWKSKNWEHDLGLKFAISPESTVSKVAEAATATCCWVPTSFTATNQ